MRHRLRVVLALAKALGERGEFLGRLFSERLAGLGETQPLGVGEAMAEEVAVRGVKQVVEGQLVTCWTVLVQLV